MYGVTASTAQRYVVRHVVPKKHLQPPADSVEHRQRFVSVTQHNQSSTKSKLTTETK